ncbi:MAB_1171c family putative transporter [Streptomyces sp. NPDC055078]
MAVKVLILVCLLEAGVWKLSQFLRNPHDAPLRSLTLCLLSGAAAYPLALPAGASGFDTVIGAGAAKLAQHLLLLAAVYFLMTFFLHSVTDERASGRARREAVVVLAVAVVLTVCAVTAPLPEFTGIYSTVDSRVHQVAGFYLVAGLYMTYALVVAGVWARQFARMSSRPHATGLWIAAWGITGIALACAVRAVFVAIRWTGGTVAESLMNGVELLLAVSVICFFLGITYLHLWSRLAAGRLWVLRLRAYRRLEPLWLLLSGTYPDTVLRPSVTRSGRLRALGVHRRHHRRVVEIRDGLLRISPYLLTLSDDAAPGPDAGDLAPRLRAAADRASRGIAASGQAIALAMPASDSRDDDARQLVKLADALRADQRPQEPHTPRHHYPRRVRRHHYALLLQAHPAQFCSRAVRVAAGRSIGDQTQPRPAASVRSLIADTD